MVRMKRIEAQCKNCGKDKVFYIPAQVPIRQNKVSGKIVFPYTFWNLFAAQLMELQCDYCDGGRFWKMRLKPVKLKEVKE